MRVFILTEGGKNIGLGHVVRCTSLYQAFKLKNISPIFLINGDDSINPILTGIDYSNKNWLDELPYFNSSDIVIIDSYLANEELYEMISKTAGLMVSFDDDNRVNYSKGIVINGNVSSNEIDYPLDNNITYLLGSSYSSLRKEFWNVEPISINNSVETILITLGGDDIRNLTPNILKLINSTFPNFNKKVIVGNSFNNLDEIKHFADENTQLIYSPNANNMLETMLKSDIAISAGGQTTYEFARIGLPAIAISIADNQTESIINWEKLGFLKYAGKWDDENLWNNISLKLNELLDFKCRKIKHDKGISIIDGLGAKRIVEVVLNEK